MFVVSLNWYIPTADYFEFDHFSFMQPSDSASFPKSSVRYLKAWAPFLLSTCYVQYDLFHKCNHHGEFRMSTVLPHSEKKPYHNYSQSNSPNVQNNVIDLEEILLVSNTSHNKTTIHRGHRRTTNRAIHLQMVQQSRERISQDPGCLFDLNPFRGNSVERAPPWEKLHIHLSWRTCCWQRVRMKRNVRRH